MIVENINKNHTGLNVLVVPLDWGLGHATRCIPIINILTKQGVKVTLAGEGPVVKILQTAAPGLTVLPLKGYRVSYSKNSRFLFLKLLIQAPKVLAAIMHERRWLKRIVKEKNIDAVISDNRFGLHHPHIPSVFITHQLSIQTGNTIFDALAQKINYHFIRQFDECWVPDFEGKPNLAGKLSHPGIWPGITVKYTGFLSRFRFRETGIKVELLVMLSGPEPQRSIFEKLLLPQLQQFPGKKVLIRGLPMEEKIPVTKNNQLIIYNHLPAEELNELILQSRQVLARCGYSTVMDLVSLKKKAILVPTPGQTEQEYLAAHLQEQRLFYTCTQEEFNLDNAITAFEKFNYSGIELNTGINEEVIIDWLEMIEEIRTGREGKS